MWLVLERKWIVLGTGVIAGSGLIGYALTKKKPEEEAPPISGAFAGFELEKINGQTTTRQGTGETATDFRFYPLINLTPDVNGDFTVLWDWRNFFDGLAVGYSSPDVAVGSFDGFSIKNIFSGMVAGQAVQIKLVDNRAGNTRGGAIAIGDVDFVALGKQDGLWHAFKTEVYQVKVKSPSGAYVDLSGAFTDNFKSTGALSASWAGLSLTKI